MADPEGFLASLWFISVMLVLNCEGQEANAPETVTVHLGVYSRKTDGVENPEFTAVLNEMGYTPEIVQKVQNSTRISVIRVVRHDDKYICMWSLSFCEKIPSRATNLPSGKQYNLTLCDGRNVVAKNEYDHEKRTLKRTVNMEGFEAEQTITEISPVSFKLHYKAKSKEVNLEFVRDYADDDVEKTIHQGSFFLSPYYDSDTAEAMLSDLGYDADMHGTILGDHGISMMRIYKKDFRYTTYWVMFLCEEPAFDEFDYVFSGEEYYLKLCDSRIVKAKNIYDEDKNQLTRIIMMDNVDCKQTASDISPLGFQLHWKMDEKEVDMRFVHSFFFHPVGETVMEGAFTLKDESRNNPEFLAVLKEMGYGPSEIEAVRHSATSVIRIAKDHDGQFITWWQLTVCEENMFEGLNLKSGQKYELTLCDGREVGAQIMYEEDSKHLIRTVQLDGFQAKQTVKDMSSEGMTVIYSVKDKQADLQFVPFKYTPPVKGQG